MAVAWKKLATLGKGSFATVYLATLSLPQEPNDKEKVVAVKSSSHFSFSIVSMQKEKRILDLFIGCKEILQCYFDELTVDERKDFTYNLFMEVAPYGSLDYLIKKKGPLTESEVRAYTIMLLKGLSCIHQKGVVHCDLKPDNILLFPNSSEEKDDHEMLFQLKIADFGMSKTKEDLSNDADSKKTKFRGTPYYMSPESVVGVIEPALDIWSLGCIVIEMITGLRAWNLLTKTKEEIMYKLLVLEAAPKIPNGLNWVCKNFLNKCFVKDPSQRWTATMLLNHPFLCNGSNMQQSSSSFFSYDIFNHMSRKG